MSKRNLNELPTYALVTQKEVGMKEIEVKKLVEKLALKIEYIQKWVKDDYYQSAELDVLMAELMAELSPLKELVGLVKKNK
jgi:hypothetical protein